jgi:hypothetical protein
LFHGDLSYYIEAAEFNFIRGHNGVPAFIHLRNEPAEFHTAVDKAIRVGYDIIIAKEIGGE